MKTRREKTRNEEKREWPLLFWFTAPLCLEDVTSEQWLTRERAVQAAPIALPLPGLLWRAHRSDPGPSMTQIVARCVKTSMDADSIARQAFRLGFNVTFLQSYDHPNQRSPCASMHSSPTRLAPIFSIAHVRCAAIGA
jgi:hypothetical protein